jgi:hypothetical protein
MRVDTGKHIDFFIFLVEQFFQLTYFTLEYSDPLLKRLGIAPRKGAAAELVACFALEADICALGATWADAIAAYFLGAAPVAGLGNAGLAIGAHLDHLHRQDAGHVGSLLRRLFLFVLG